MSNKNDLKLLKEAFCDFFAKVLPLITDPEQIVRTRWMEFRSYMLDDSHNPLDVFLFAQRVQISNNAPSYRTNLIDTANQQKQVPQPRPVAWKAQQVPFITEPKQDVPIFATPAQSRRQISTPAADMQNRLISQRMRTQDEIQNNTPQEILGKYNLKIKLDPVDTIKEDIEKVDVEEIRGLTSPIIITGSPKHQQTFPFKKPAKYTFPGLQSLMTELKDAIDQFRKHGVTLGCVYDRSHEINTGGIEETNPQSVLKQQLQKRFTQEVQQKMANYDMQQIQRNMPFKECSVYSKQRGLQPLQRIEQAIEKEYEQPNAYQGRKDGRKVTGRKLYLQ